MNVSIAREKDDVEEDEAAEREAERQAAIVKYHKGIGRGVVLLSDAQIGALLEELSLEEFEKYVDVVATCEERGKKYKKKTHYQAIREMALRDRKTKQ